MPFPVIRIDDPGGFVASCVIIGAGLIKGAVELPEIIAKLKRKRNKNNEEPETNAKPKAKIYEEEEVEIVSKKDFDLVLEEIKSANIVLGQARNSFEDTLACMGVINIMFAVMGKYSLDYKITLAETEIYTFLRHNEFPSKIMITAMLEQAIKEAHQARKETQDGLDSRPNN